MNFPAFSPLAPVTAAPRSIVSGMAIWFLTMSVAQILFLVCAEPDAFGGDIVYIGAVVFPFANVIAFLSLIGTPFVILHLIGIHSFLFSEIATSRLVQLVGLNQIIVAFIAFCALDGISSRAVVAFLVAVGVWVAVLRTIRHFREPSLP